MGNLHSIAVSLPDLVSDNRPVTSVGVLFKAKQRNCLPIINHMTNLIEELATIGDRPSVIAKERCIVT